MDTNELISAMINKISDGDNTAAQDDFASLLSTKVSAALDAKKQEIAQGLYASEAEVETAEEESEEVTDGSETEQQ